MLTLPSLQDLEIRGPFGAVDLDDNNDDNLYSRIRKLVPRSQCPLTRLALDMGWSIRDDADQEWDGPRRILDLLPHLQELDVAISPGQQSSRTLQGLTVGEDVHYLYDALLPDLQIWTFRLAWVPSPDEDSDLGSDGGSGLMITTTMEGEEGGAEEGQAEDQEQGTGEEGDDDDEEKEASGEEPVDPWGDMPGAHIFGLTSFDNSIRSRTRSESVTGIVPPSLVKVRLALPENVETTGLLLRRIQFVCDFNLKFKEEGPSAEDSTGTPNVVASHHRKAYDQVNEVMLLRRQSIYCDRRAVNEDEDCGDEPSAFAVKHTQQPGHGNEVSTKSKMRTRT